MCRIVIVAFVGGIPLEVFTVRDRRFQRFPVSRLQHSCLGGFAMDTFLEINVSLDCGSICEIHEILFSLHGIRAFAHQFLCGDIICVVIDERVKYYNT